MEEASQLLGWVLQNSSFSKQDIPNLPKLWHIGPSTFLYVNMTNVVVNSDTVLYMCMEVIICQSDMSPEM